MNRSSDLTWRAIAAGAVLALAAAIAYHGAARRYSVTRMNQLYLIRTDHFTGSSVACTIDERGTQPQLLCEREPATDTALAPAPAADPVASYLQKYGPKTKPRD